MEEFLRQWYDSKEIQAFRETIESPPLITTLRVNTLKTTAVQAAVLLQQHFKEKNLAFQIRPNPYFQDCLEIDPIGPSGVNPVSKEIIVDCACGSALLRGADLYAAGVVGMDDSIEKGDVVSIWADLEGSCLKGWKREYHGRKKFIGNGECKVSRSDIFKEDLGSIVAVKMTQMKYLMPSLNGVFSDLLFLQNLPSIMVSHLLAPLPSSRVLDMCASPGGKTCHLAAIMENSGEIWACDNNSIKTRRIEQNCELLGVKNVVALTRDSTKLLQNNDFCAESFDFILLDPPCSGLGQRPKLKYNPSEWSNLPSYAVYQERLFREAWSLLKPGGHLLYSTCTVNPLENEVLVAKVLETYTDAQLLPIRARADVAKYCLPGLPVNGLDSLLCEQSLCRFWPSSSCSDHDSIGFFICKFEKTKK